MIRGIIFDLGGTLITFAGKWDDADKIATANLAAFLSARGFALRENFAPVFFEHRKQQSRRAEETGVEARVEDALRNTLLALGHFSTDGLLPRAVETYLGEFENRWRAYPDALATLQELRARSLRIGLISNADDVGTVHRLCARLGLSPYLDPIRSSAEEPRWRKPDPRIFHLVADAWRITPNEIAMVGDATRYDVVGAHRAGMRAILIDRGDNAAWQKIPEDKVDDPEWKADAVVRSLAEVNGVIGKW